MEKSYLYRIYPNKKQKELLSQFFGSTRFVYNYFLNQRKEAYEKDKISLNYYDNAKALTLLKKDEDYS